VEIPGAVSVSAVVPVEESDLLLVLVGCKVCLIHRETGVVIQHDPGWGQSAVDWELSNLVKVIRCTRQILAIHGRITARFVVS